MERLNETADRAALSAVLPLRAGNHRDGRDLERAELLFLSLRRFASPGLFARILVVTPPDEVAPAQAALAEWDDLALEFVAETDLVPEFRRYPTVSGWTKQQLVKLAASRRVETDYYLTFDADVVCTLPIDGAGLLPGGRALLQEEPKSVHRDWWLASAKMLKVPPRIEETGMSVTPALLSAGACRGLIETLDRLAGRGSWADYLMRPHRRRTLHHLHPGYRRRYRWTEYALYFLYCRERGLLSELHATAGSAEVPQTLISSASVWSQTPLETWDPSLVFSGRDPALFCVIQSNKEQDPAALKVRLDRYLAPPAHDTGAACPDVT